MAMSKYLSIISITTLNINGLNAAIKRHRVAEWIRKHDPHMLPTRVPPQNKRPTQAENEGLQERYWQKHNYSRGFWHPIGKDGQIFQTKYQQRYCGIEQCPTWNGLNWYRVFHPEEAKYTFFTKVHGIFSKRDHMIGHKKTLNKFKKIEIIPSIFSNHKGLKLERNLKEKTPNTQKHGDWIECY